MRDIDLKDKTILVTGAAGFIGANLAKRLLSDGLPARIVGIDNMNDYYDVSIKEFRLREIEEVSRKKRARAAAGHVPEFVFIRGSIADRELVGSIFSQYRPQLVVNLAAQAGVRHSISHPDEYIESNIVGFYNILEACRHSYDEVPDPQGKQDAQETQNTRDRQGARETPNTRDIQNDHGVEHLIYASSSSVYGMNAKIPYSTEDRVDNPVSLYAATKKSDELMAHAYARLYNIPSTGLRFFTVYGPAGRPDMAYYGFTDKLVRGETIRIFNYGNCMRDFTYIDDVIEGVVRVMRRAPERRTGEDGLPVPPYRLYNIGNSHPENLLEFISVLQEELVRAGVLPEDFDFESHRELVPMQPGDVPVTCADTAPLERDFGYRPHTRLREGIRRFAQWYAGFYGYT